MKRIEAERQAMMEKARSRHQRKHPDQTPPPDASDQSLLFQVQGAVTAAAQVVGNAAKTAVEAIKDAVAPKDTPPVSAPAAD